MLVAPFFGLFDRDRFFSLEGSRRRPRDLERLRSRERDLRRGLSPRVGSGEPPRPPRRCLFCATRVRQTCSQSKFGSFSGFSLSPLLLFFSPSLSFESSSSLSLSSSFSLFRALFLSFFSHLSSSASAQLILSCPGLFSAKTPSAVMPTRLSPTISKISAAGTKAHSLGVSPSGLPGAGGSAVKSDRCRSQPHSGVLAHSAISLQSAAHICRTSGSVKGAAKSMPRGNTAQILPRHFLAHSEGLGPSSSSHMLPLSFLSASFSSFERDHTRTFNLSWNSRQSPISGNCIMTACQFPRTQSLCRLASAKVPRFNAHKNCARNFFFEQS
mmetsp:Transcript_4473/g.16959  ORF Transcript_4473/g.16959 Transcript_4473/m.16959 type:complete len:327 (-) Transcript_4473:1074-2054(-)